MAIRTAYGPREKIDAAIANGVIPAGSIIITKEDGPHGELIFYDSLGQRKMIASKNKFESMDEAKQWVESYDCTGEFLSIRVNGSYGMYLVQDNGAISPTDSAQYIEEYKTHLEFPNLGKSHCLYVATDENDGAGYLYRWSSTHKKYFRPDDAADKIEAICGGNALDKF